MVRFRTNKIFEKNRQDRKGVGIGLVYPSAEAIEIVGMMGGFDFVNLDGEHGPFSPESVDEMCQRTLVSRKRGQRQQNIPLFQHLQPSHLVILRDLLGIVRLEHGLILAHNSAVDAC